MAVMARYADIKIIFSSELENPVSVRRATFFYDFYYNVLYWATWIENIHIIAYLGSRDGNIVLSLIPSEDAGSFQMSRDVMDSAASAGGEFTLKDLDGDFSLNLSFPKSPGGDGNG
jgi:hypothetical protein